MVTILRQLAEVPEIGQKVKEGRGWCLNPVVYVYWKLV